MIEDLSLREGVEFEFIPSRFFGLGCIFTIVTIVVNHPRFYETQC